MVTVVDVPKTIPPLPKSWKAPSKSSGSTSPLVERKLLPSGPAYIAHVRRAMYNLSFEEHDKYMESQKGRLRAANDNGVNLEDDLGVGDEEETDELLSLDPKEWKKQDHYAVLGLSHLRYRATLEQIKIAHRKKVLKHHPDKKAGIAGHSANDDAFFKCIQKAYDLLINPTRRAQFDSVDPHYEALESDAPTAAQFKSHAKPAKSHQEELAREREFFREFSPVFEREARFSRVQPVPLLGAPDASKDDVERFYDFWYNFDSWRSFEYLDKEVNEGSDNRDDKRYTEKKNKAERARRKKEDTARLRSLVDLTLSLDPRIKRIKQEEKASREAKKRNNLNRVGSGASTPSARAQEEEEKKKRDAELDAEKEKLAKAEAKKAKAAAANAAKKARRQQRAAEDGAAS